MDPGRLSRSVLPGPKNELGFRVPDGFHPCQMTRLAGNSHVGIMGHLFVMGKVTLATIFSLLISVLELIGVEMTYSTGDPGMRN